MALSDLNKLNISTIIKILLLLYNLTLKSFFKKTLKIFRLLLIISRINLEKTPNIN